LSSLTQTFSVFIPAYNADKTLSSVLNRIPGDVWTAVKTVWIVNDGSTDSTADVIEKAAVQYLKIRGVTLPENRGYGGAVKEALARIRAEAVDIAVCLHADGQYAPERIPNLVAAIQTRQLDLLQGSRIASGTALSGGMPLYKYVAGRALTTLENIVFKMKMTDYHSGYMVYGKKALVAIPFDRLSNSFDFDLEVIATARSLGLSIGEEPVPTRYGDEVSHLSPVPYGFRVLRVLRKYVSGYYGRIAHHKSVNQGPEHGT
jgi:glycosyltransferase involved in cell wall biosynthesis